MLAPAQARLDSFSESVSSQPLSRVEPRKRLPGALLLFFQESGCDLSKVTGVDLSAGMLSFARERCVDGMVGMVGIFLFVFVGGWGGWEWNV